MGACNSIRNVPYKKLIYITPFPVVSFSLKQGLFDRLIQGVMGTYSNGRIYQQCEARV